ncbi:MAG: HNH endonuclease, partial [Mycobacteriales bacterium]
VRADQKIRTTKGGTGYISHGYRIVPVPRSERHLSSGEHSIAEHRLVMARHLGRALESTESVHHKNGQRLDNRLANLELWSRWQPKGQRIEDKLAWAVELLTTYAPGLLPKL